MRIIYSKLIPFRGFRAVNMLGVVFARKEYRPLPDRTLTHEAIHTAQQKEMLYLPFYLWYGVEWLMRWAAYGFKGKKAYRSMLLEREAYRNDGDLKYLEQ